MQLTAEEGRVLGCLMEKERTTPDAYPLSPNALLAACNQQTNRDPVVAYDDDIVERALGDLRAHGLSGRTVEHGGRVTRHRNLAEQVLGLDAGEAAVLCVLLLRGGQTPGELKGRTARLHDFDDLAAVEAALESLADRPTPLVVRLAREPGRKESRWATTLTAANRPAGIVHSAPVDAVSPVDAPLPADASPPDDLVARVGALEIEVERLRAEVAARRERDEAG